MHIALVSCVKSKLDRPAPAKELYTSALFRAMLGYAEANADALYILSAEYGLLAPETIVAPYEKTLAKMGLQDRNRWAIRVQTHLTEVLPESAGIVVLAGKRYRESLVPFLLNRGHELSIPMEGLTFGKQLQYLNAIRDSRAY